MPSLYALLLMAVFVPSLAFACFSATIENKERADVDTLIHVQVIMRHGARAPFEEYPEDPYKGFSWWENSTDAYEGLTVIGREQHYNLGQLLRRRYDGFLNQKYLSTEFRATSSETDRSLMSALSNLAGLYPPEDAVGHWNTQINWQPVPVYMLPLSNDWVIGNAAHCGRLGELQHESFFDTERAKEINADPGNQAVFNYISKQSGKVIDSWHAALQFYDILYSQDVNGFELPKWTEEVYPEPLLGYTRLGCSREFFTPDDETRRLRSGRLLSVATTNMEEAVKGVKAPKPKFLLFSGHDVTVSPLFNILADSDFEKMCTPLAAALLLEVHKADAKQTSTDLKDHFVRLFFRNDSSVPPYELEIPDCGYPCRLRTFKAVFSHLFFNTDAEAVEACKPHSNTTTGGTFKLRT